VTLWSVIKLVMSLAEPLRSAVADVIAAIKSGDADGARRALEATLRLQFEARQAARK
jgi:hypothetical protein